MHKEPKKRNAFETQSAGLYKNSANSPSRNFSITYN